MKNKIEFNWEKYQSGEYDVITRDGRKVEQLHKFSVDSSYGIYGVINGDTFARNWYDNGNYWDDEDKCDYDLFLIPKVKEGPIVEANEIIIPELKGVLMEVSDYENFRPYNFFKCNVVGKCNDRYVCLEVLENGTLHFYTYKYARPIKEVKECWVNVYEVNEMIEVGASFKTKEEAEKMIKKERKYIKTICITNELETNEH